MKTLNDIGIRVIKTENRKGDDVIRKIQGDINTVIFKFLYKPITKIACEKLMEEISRAGKTLREHEEKDIYTPRKTEVLCSLRADYRLLKDYYENGDIIPTADDEDIIRKQFNYVIADYLKDKKEGNNYDVYEYLKRFREVYDYWYMPYKVNVGESEKIVKTARNIIKELNEKAIWTL